MKSYRLCLLWLFGVWVSMAFGQTPRPASVTIVEKFGLKIALTAMTYPADAPADFAQPVTATGTLTAGGFGVEQVVEGVTVEGLILKPDGKWQDGTLVSPREWTFKHVLATDIDFVFPQGTKIRRTEPNFLEFQAATNGTGPKLIFPMRDEDGTPVSISADKVAFTEQSNGFDLRVTGGRLVNSLTTKGLELGQFLAKTSGTVDLSVAQRENQPTEWRVNLRDATVKVPLLGVLTKEDKPLEFLIQNLAVDQEGKVTFSKAQVRNAPEIECVNPTGFKVKIKPGTELEMNKDEIVGFTVVCDITLPSDFTTAAGDPVILRNVTVQAVREEGWLLALPGTIDGEWKGMKFSATNLALDMSETLVLPNIPAAANDLIKAPKFTGIFVGSGKLELPTVVTDKDGNPVKVTATNFAIEGQGITGNVSVTTDIRDGKVEGIAGFDVDDLTGSLTFTRGQITSSALSGDLKVAFQGNPNPKRIKFDLGLGEDGFVTIDIHPNEKVPIPELGMEVEIKNGRLIIEPDGTAKVFVSGSLKFGQVSAFPGMANLNQALSGARVSVKDLGFDSRGNLYLPTEGNLALGQPLIIDLKVIKVEGREIGFESENNQITALTLSGGVDLGKEAQLPISGSVDFEGLKIARDGPDADSLPDFSVGKLSLDLEIHDMVKAAGTVEWEDRDDFGGVFSGGAKLDISGLGAIDVRLIIGEKLWFVGAGALMPVPITVIDPSSGTPLFNMYGFFGGFGYGVEKKESVVRITRLEDLNVRAGNFVAQGGLVFGDQVTGNLWWGEGALTLGFPALVIDIGANLSFLDMNGPGLVESSYWDEADRVANVFARLDLSEAPRKISFVAGGSVFMGIPTRAAPIATLEGEARLELSNTQQYVRVGWEPAGQKAVKLQLGQAASGVDISLKGGFEVNFKDLSAAMFAVGRVEVDAGIRIEADAYVDLAVDLPSRNQLRNKTVAKLALPEASGRLSVSGKVYFPDFPGVSATTSANLTAQFNTPSHRNKLFASGEVKGTVRVFGARVSASAGFAETLVTVR